MKNRTTRGLSLLSMSIATAAADAQTLVAHYELNEGAGTTCFDSSSNQLHGTYRSAFTLGQPASSAGCGASVAFDDAAMTDVVIQGAPPLDSLTSELTVCAWINPDALPPVNNVRRIFGNNNGGWTCGLWGDGLIFTTRFVRDYLIPGAGITPQTWTHVAFAFDANHDVTFYVNGVSLGTELGASPANFPNPEWFIGGFDGNVEFWDGLIDDVQIYDGVLTGAQIATLSQNSCSTLGGPPTLGMNYCGPAVVNASGTSASIAAFGSPSVSLNGVTLECSSMPNASFAFFLTSLDQGFIAMPGGSLGNLCLSGAIGRYVGPGQIQNSGGVGLVQLGIDLASHPTPTGLISVFPGETWNFQCWFRDSQVGSATSNFSDGLQITFL